MKDTPYTGNISGRGIPLSGGYLCQRDTLFREHLSHGDTSVKETPYSGNISEREREGEREMFPE